MPFKKVVVFKVFNNSLLVRDITINGPGKYFGNVETYHLIGDAAFPIKRWLMKPYRQQGILGRRERRHNYILSSDRVVIEHTFGILKGRWRRLHFINTYSVSKAIEIATCACVLHNFCIRNNDEWAEEFIEEDQENEAVEHLEDNNRERQLGEQKRNRIASNFL